jgi:uncharacterized protein with PIN domain
MTAYPRFVADAMLGSTARKLRIFGFDTLYHDASRIGDDEDDDDDSKVEGLARKEERVILTSDRALFEHARKAGIRAILVVGETDKDRLRSILKQSGPAMKRHLSEARSSSHSYPHSSSSGESHSSSGARTTSSRCAVCNGELQVMGRYEAKSTMGAVIPTNALSRHRLFFRCMSCSKFYWRGKHWERLRRLSYALA